jgi:hypothetical protein
MKEKAKAERDPGYAHLLQSQREKRITLCLTFFSNIKYSKKLDGILVLFFNYQTKCIGYTNYSMHILNIHYTFSNIDRNF